MGNLFHENHVVHARGGGQVQSETAALAGGASQAPAETPPAPLPSAVRPFYEARRGFTNHHFNTV
jgi:hypothetical protein